MKKNVCAFLVACSLNIMAFAQHNSQSWGDLGNGKFRNQILPADYCDPDVLRIGKDYYLISSTFQFSPGIVIMHSNDLVNWKTIGSVVKNLPLELKDNRFDYTVMDHYSKGIYAPSLKYHHKQFWVYFTTYNKGGIYVATASKITGPWKVELMKDKNGKELFGLNWDDPCPLWDDDGKNYLVASHPGSNWYPILFQLSADGKQLLDGEVEKMAAEKIGTIGTGTHIYPKATWGEGNKIFKKDGYYYLFHNECFGKDYDRRAVMIRSKNIYGTHADGKAGSPGNPGKYDVSPQGTSTYVMVQPDSTGGRFDQGSIIDDPTGKKWYFLTHQGGGTNNGRPISLLPVKWIDGWPMAGNDYNHDGIGEPVWELPMPAVGGKKSFPQGSDEFNHPQLHPQWMWNYQPRSDKWSLSHRKGFLRLYAFKPLPNNYNPFFKAGNTIGQRYVKSDSVTATIKMDISGMENGQEAGLAHYNGGSDYASIGIIQNEKGRFLKFTENWKINLGIAINSNTIWLKSIVNNKGINQYYYSINGVDYIPFGPTYTLKWGGYRGDNIGMYSFNNQNESGFVDIDWFHYQF